jgi:diguanylate cyclase (GGDEF)-like protein/PAS domain S-box-containing protein
MAVLLLCAVALLAVSQSLVEHQRGIAQKLRYSMTWDASLAQISSMRLQLALAELELFPDASTEDATLRYSILYANMKTLQNGDIHRALADHQDYLGTLAAFEQTVEAIGPLIADLGKPGTSRRIIAMLSPLTPKLTTIAAFASTLDAENVTDSQEQLSRDHLRMTGLMIALMLDGVFLVGLLSRRNRLLWNTHRTMQQLTDDLWQKTGALQVANRAVQEANADLIRHNQHFHAALDNMTQGLCMVDADQRLVVCNQRFIEMFGLEDLDLQPQISMLDLIGDPTAEDATYRLPRALYAEHLILRHQQRQSVFLHETADGRALTVSHRPMPHGGWVATYEDVTAKRRTEERIAFMAHHDALTGLPNRVMYRERLETLLAEYANFDSKLSVLLLDLDHFKEINDSLGHGAGDSLLQAVANRLRSVTRDADLVARLGGDEFAVILTVGPTDRDAAHIADRIIGMIGEPFEIDGHHVVVGVSVGIATQPAAGATAELLLKYADMALYQAKAKGRGTWCFYEPEMDQKVQVRRALSADLRDAIRLGQFETHYQSLVDLADDHIAGFEALVRWRHPDRGMILPGQFIGLAEETGLIVAIGEWVLKRACEDAAAWPARVRVSVNLSARQFRDNSVARSVRSALEQTGLDPARLDLEITESLLLQDGDEVLTALRELRGLGVGLALDDFGTGYASLSYLRKFPFSKLKIDQSFVRGMEHRDDCIIIIQSVAAMAKRLGMTVTAEGIETDEQYAIVREAGCTHGQGYRFGRPVPLAEAQRLLAEDAKRDRTFQIAI